MIARVTPFLRKTSQLSPRLKYKINSCRQICAQQKDKDKESSNDGKSEKKVSTLKKYGKVAVVTYACLNVSTLVGFFVALDFNLVDTTALGFSYMDAITQVYLVLYLGNSRHSWQFHLSYNIFTK